MRTDQPARNETFAEEERAREWMRDRLRSFVIPAYHSFDIFNTFARSIPFASLSIRSFPYRLHRLTIALFYSSCRIIHRLAISLGSKSLPSRRWTSSRVHRARQLSILSTTNSMLERWLNRSLILSEYNPGILVMLCSTRLATVQRDHDKRSMPSCHLHRLNIRFYRAIHVVSFHHLMEVHRVTPRRSCRNPTEVKRIHRSKCRSHRRRIRKPSADIAKVIICLNVSTHVRFLVVRKSRKMFLSHSSSFDVWWEWCSLLSRAEEVPLRHMHSCDQSKHYAWRRVRRWWQSYSSATVISSVESSAWPCATWKCLPLE